MQLSSILLVDDDRVTNLMHQRQIQRRGLARQVDVSTDGLAALERIRQCADRDDAPPELVLLDINMPRMNGFEFLAEYAELPEHVRRKQRIIMVSTSTLRRDVERAEKDPNVHEFANKPLTDADLERIVRECQTSIGA